MRDKSSNTQDRSGHVFNLASISYFFFYFILYGLATKGGSIIVLRMLMSTKWRGRRYINQASSSEKKIRLVFILLYWYAENRRRVDLTVNEETEAVTQAMGPL